MLAAWLDWSQIQQGSARFKSIESLENRISDDRETGRPALGFRVRVPVEIQGSVIEIDDT